MTSCFRFRPLFLLLVLLFAFAWYVIFVPYLILNCKKEAQSMKNGANKNLMVIDCFIYNGEPIVAPRLAILNPHVDFFFIAEFSLTFSGKKKETLYKDINADIFKPFEDKIIWMNTDEIEGTNGTRGAWDRETAQRNAGIASIKKEVASGCITQPFVILNTDVDEIPNPLVIEKLQPGKELHDIIKKGPISLNMEFFYYNFNWLRGSWNKAMMLPGSDIVEGKYTLDIRKSKKSLTVKNGGWHCTYCNSIDGLINKLESFSHQEYNKPQFKSKEHLKDCIGNGTDFLNRGGGPFQVYDYHQLPQPLQNFHEALTKIQGIQ